MRVAQCVRFNRAVQRRECHAFAVSRPITLGCQFHCTLLHSFLELRRLHSLIHQTPIHRLLAAHAFYAGAKNIRQIVAHFALIRDAGEAARAGQHAEQRHFRQAHGAGAVVYQNDFIASQRHLVAAACACTVHRSNKFQAAVGG